MLTKPRFRGNMVSRETPKIRESVPAVCHGTLHEGGEEMPKALRMVVALSVTVLLLVALAGLAAQAGSFSPATSMAVADGSSPVQVGDAAAMDPKTGLPPEDPPYTQAEPIFNPQLAQAPVKDSLTWNPLFMSEFETFDENQATGLYNQIFAGSRNATEKVWFRQWYEPWHWDKDWNANGTLDINPPGADSVHPDQGHALRRMVSRR